MCHVLEILFADCIDQYSTLAIWSGSIRPVVSCRDCHLQNGLHLMLLLGAQLYVAWRQLATLQVLWLYVSFSDFSRPQSLLGLPFLRLNGIREKSKVSGLEYGLVSMGLLKYLVVLLPTASQSVSKNMEQLSNRGK